VQNPSHGATRCAAFGVAGRCAGRMRRWLDTRGKGLLSPVRQAAERPALARNSKTACPFPSSLSEWDCWLVALAAAILGASSGLRGSIGCLDRFGSSDRTLTTLIYARMA
jgi:hypothetical protein